MNTGLNLISDADQPMGQHPTDEQLTDCQVSSYHSWGTSVGKFERGFEVKKFCLQCLKESIKNGSVTTKLRAFEVGLLKLPNIGFEFPFKRISTKSADFATH